MATEAAAVAVDVNDYAGKLIMAVKVGDTKVEALERLSGIRGVLMDNKGVGLLDADLISLESGPYVFKAKKQQQNGKLLFSYS
jgi:hypothetical protein